MEAVAVAGFVERAGGTGLGLEDGLQVAQHGLGEAGADPADVAESTVGLVVDPEQECSQGAGAPATAFGPAMLPLSMDAVRRRSASPMASSARSSASRSK